MCHWMRSLATHYERVRKQYPEDRLLLLFDIDGTILDMRHMVRHVLLWFDRAHGTQFFHGLEVDDIDVHENQLDAFLKARPLATADRERIADWYLAQRWTPAAVLEAHRPYRGVMDVIRWFQLQPETSVGLNTGRPERLRDDTLRSLNALGREYRVKFDSQLLQMNPHDWEVDVAAAKATAIDYFRTHGYRVFAVVDNEPGNIQAMQDADRDGEILFLHADTLFESQHSHTPRTVRGNSYDLTNLVAPQHLPQHVQFVWHGINDRANLRQFLASPIQWGECDVRRDPLGRVVLRHDSFEETPWDEQEELLPLAECFDAIHRQQRSIKIDFKEGGELLDHLLELTAKSELSDDQLWFNGNIELLGEEGHRKLAAARPGAVLQCPIDFLVPLILAVPQKARDILQTFAQWGINRYSLSWQIREKRTVVEQLQDWGYDVNIYNVEDLESFLQAALLLPRSVTSDFNFPTWHYYGRGAGQYRAYHQYHLEPNHKKK